MLVSSTVEKIFSFRFMKLDSLADDYQTFIDYICFLFD